MNQNLLDIVTLVANDKQAEASAILTDELSSRVFDAIQNRKTEIGQHLFAPIADSIAEETATKVAKKD